MYRMVMGWLLVLLLSGCASQGERVIREVAGQWSVRLYTERSFALGERSHYRVYHRGQLVRLAPPLLQRLALAVPPAGTETLALLT